MVFPEKFVQLFRHELSLNEDQYRSFCAHFHREFVPKKNYYLREGDSNKLKAYVVKGCTRNFIIDEDGKEKTMYFSFEDWWLGDIESFLTGRPCKQYIQAIEDLELLCISKADFFKLAESVQQLNTWFQGKIQKTHFATIDRLMDSKAGSIEKRYLDMINKHPDIFKRVPLQYIASYLNIEPQSLSRLRKRVWERS